MREHVAAEAARGIAEVSRATGVPVASGIITASTRAQALARSRNRGEEAAQAAVELAALLGSVRGPRAPGRLREGRA